MKLNQLLVGMLLLVVFILVGCGQRLDSPSTQSGEDKAGQSDIQAMQIDNNHSSKWSELAASTKQQEQVDTKEIIQLLEPIDQVRQEVVDQIEDNGWYQSVEEIEPSLQEFETVVRPIVTPYFTDRFIDEEILANMEAFFCFCDATGPMLGSMYPDVVNGFNQDENELVFEAFLPSDQINSGLKVEVTAVKAEDKWKVDRWQPLYSTHQKSFDLSVDEIKAYYQEKGMAIKHVDTITDPHSQEKVYLFEQETSDQLIAIQSRDWLIVEGSDRIEAFYEWSPA
ncbi:hypothetical protein [Aquibacillus sediminis]|uniref:hypothetical protein n=1 Tax=Aquibacillus sediminis TaxID=2574734 RepID=UPI001109BFD7|nr:hypothetical protein [Aquibacillus sediminis]